MTIRVKDSYLQLGAELPSDLKGVFLDLAPVCADDGLPILAKLSNTIHQQYSRWRKTDNAMLGQYFTTEVLPKQLHAAVVVARGKAQKHPLKRLTTAKLSFPLVALGLSVAARQFLEGGYYRRPGSSLYVPYLIGEPYGERYYTPVEFHELLSSYVRMPIQLYLRPDRG